MALIRATEMETPPLFAGNAIVFRSAGKRFFSPIANVAGRTNIAFKVKTDIYVTLVLASTTDHTKMCE